MIELERIDGDRIADLVGLFGSTWWAAGRTANEAQALVDHSTLVIGLVDEEAERMIAFARVLTDGIFFAMVFDVVVAPEHRGTGLGRELMERLLRRRELRGVRSVELVCQPDLIPFYEQFGFSADVGMSQLMRRTSEPKLRSQPRTG